MGSPNRPSGHSGRWYHLLLALFILLWTGCRTSGDTIIVRNGDLTASTAGSPQDWRPGIEAADLAVYRWHYSHAAPGELEISNLKPNDSRWSRIHLEPGWYHFSANIRTENISLGPVGANLSILAGSILTRPLNGTHEWQEVGFYLKVESSADVVLTCRLGGFSSPTTGTAFFRDIRASRITEPPPGAERQFDLDFERGIKVGNQCCSNPSKYRRRGRSNSAPGRGTCLMPHFLFRRVAQTIASIGSAMAALPRLLSSRANQSDITPAWAPTPIEATLVALGAVAFTLAFSYPILLRLPLIGSAWDWSEKLSHAWVTVNSIKTFHQIPLWDPYSCGGMPLLANPLFPAFTPWFGLNLILTR